MMGSIASPDPETVSRLETATVVFANCFAYTQEVKHTMLQVCLRILSSAFVNISGFLLGNSGTLPIWHFADFIVEILWTLSVESAPWTQGACNYVLSLNFWEGGNA